MHLQRAITRRRALTVPLAAAGAVVLGGVRRPAADRLVGGAPTEEAAPSPTPELAGRREAILMAAYDALPAAPAAITLTRLNFPPLSRVAGDGAAGPRLLLVEGQTITVVLAGEGLIHPAAAAGGGPDAAPGSAAAGGEVVLAKGDGLVVDAPPRELRNDGQRPAALLIAEVVPLPAGLNGVLPAPVASPALDDPAGTPPPAAGTPTASVEALPVKPFLTAEGVLVEPLAGGAATALPEGPGEVRLDRLSLPVGRDDPLPVQPGPWLLLVESGQLGLAARDGTILYRSAAAVNPGTVPGRAKRVAPGSEILVTARGMVFLHPAAEATLRNRGRTTLSLLALAIVPTRADVVRAPAIGQPVHHET